jgi:hypothetical protein
MTSRLTSLLPTLCGLLIWAGATGPAHADNVYVNANQCQPADERSADSIVHEAFGVHTAPDAPATVTVSCPLWRAPLATAPRSSFLLIVDGTNLNGAVTPCVVSVRNGQTGELLGSNRVVLNQPIYSQQFVPAGATDALVYLSMLCEMPARNQGTLRGWEWLQR